MKRILAIIALGAAAAASFTGCDNSDSAGSRLAAAVDSINTVMQQNPVDFADSTSITYDESSNTVKYTFILPDAVDSARMAAAQSMLEQAILLTGVLNEPEFGSRLVEAGSDISVYFEGKNGGTYEFMIESQTIGNTYRSISSPTPTND